MVTNYCAQERSAIEREERRMIRKAQDADYSRCIELVKSWFKFLSAAENLAFDCDTETLAKTFSIYNKHVNGFTAVYEEDGIIKGFMAGVLTRFKINANQKLAEENFCFGETKEIEDTLKNHFEDWARSQNCNYVLNSCYDMRYETRFRRL